MDVQEDLAVNNAFDDEKKVVLNSMNKQKTIRVIVSAKLYSVPKKDD